VVMTSAYAKATADKSVAALSHCGSAVSIERVPGPGSKIEENPQAIFDISHGFVRERTPSRNKPVL
jgi:hypothetical protein